LEVINQDKVMQNAMEGKFDGILGLAYDSGIAGIGTVAKTQETIINAMIEQKLLDEPVFAFWLNASTDGRTYFPEGGEMTLGGANPDRYQGQLTYFPVTLIPALNSRYFWATTTTSLSLGSTTYALSRTTYSIFDTGTTLIAIDSATFNAVLKTPLTNMGIKMTMDAGGVVYLVDCIAATKAPDLVFKFQGSDQTFNLTYKDYILTDGQLCFVGIQTIDNIVSSGTGLWILGDVFLRKYYSVYDVGQSRIGLGLSNGVAPPMPLPTTGTNPSGAEALRFSRHWVGLAVALLAGVGMLAVF
jgi:saccharopepsin